MLDALTDIAGRYMLVLAQATAAHAATNHAELEIAVEDVRMAMQECGALVPEKVWEDEGWDGKEDVRGVEAFVEWARGEANREIRRVALEGGEGGTVGGDDYLTGEFCRRMGAGWD